MKELHQKKMVAVTHATAEGFQEAFNSAIENLGTSHYELQFNVNMGHCVYILYDHYEQVPENLKDEYELRGDTHHCAECPYLEPNRDMRLKYNNCICGRTTPDSACCLKFYQELERGTLVPR